MNWAYGQTLFEPSPLNRVIESFAPGVNWVGTAGNAAENNRRSIKTKYLLNTAADTVHYWSVNENAYVGLFASYSTTSQEVYAPNELYKTMTLDETNKQVIEFKDKEGRVVLKKVQVSDAVADNGSGSGHAGWLCTYYIYDDLGNLRCVVQPRGVEMLAAGNWDLSNSLVLDEQCFRYEYDSRNRMIMKKVPGACEVYMVYDARDRLVMTQDANQRPLKWTATLYDALNRPVQTGIYLNTHSGPYPGKTFAQHLAAAAVSTAYPFSPTSTPNLTYWEILTKTGYDNYASLPGASGLNATLNTTYQAGHLLTPYNTAPLYAQDPQKSEMTRGLVTWTQTKVLESNPLVYLYTVNLYDEKGRLIQVKAKNLTGGEDIMTTQYNWAGQPLLTVYRHEKAGTPSQATVTVTKMSYDELGRLLNTEKKLSNSLVNGGAFTGYNTVATLEYDALGQLKRKTVGSRKDAQTQQWLTPREPLQAMEYDYNIRGWMLGMNRGYLATEGQTGDGVLFGFELGYDKTENRANRNFAAGQYNGNIGGMLWKSDGDDVRRKYDFSYDGVNRLMKADFEQHDPGGSWGNSVVNYTVRMGNGTDAATAYDANGNIKAMVQYGYKLGGNPQDPLDELVYQYYLSNSSNRLQNVKDLRNDPATKLGDFRVSALHVQTKTTGTIDYAYDENGNMTKDLNKDIGKAATTGVFYNHLNLPRLVNIYTTGGALKGSVVYVYDGVGNKLRKVVTENNVTVAYGGNNYPGVTVTTTTSYLGGFVYESKAYSNGTVNSGLGYADRLQFMGHEEGRIRAVYDNTGSPNTPTGLEYDYMIKDHLGNLPAGRQV